MKILGQPLCGFRKAVRATARVKMRWEGIQLISNILGTFSNWGVGSAAQIKAIKQAATTQINLEASASIPTWHLEANVPVRSLSSFIEKSWGAAVKGDSKLWPRHADLTLKVSRSLLFSKKVFWATSFLARLPKMLLGIKVQEGVRICFDFTVDLQVSSGKSQEKQDMCMTGVWTHIQHLQHTSKFEKQTYVQTPHHLLYHHLQSTQHTVVARETAQWTTCWHLFWTCKRLKHLGSIF